MRADPCEPAAGSRTCYVRKPGDATFHPLALDVLRIEDGAVAEIVVFSLDESLLETLGLPPTL